MVKRMTVVFDDDELYTAVKVEAARSGRHAKDIVADAVREWLEILEDRELSQDLDEVRAEMEREGTMELGEFLGQDQARSESAVRTKAQ